ncbi:MAG TPA: CDP-alcohol phosphatidyltransferase family protein [Anaerolineaceae bacterium]|nr:CDP-alcohol phosphatidyltransferase family protein [Anaerolineaceae bacterium]
MPEYIEPKRVNDIWLGNLEQRALQWMVRRLPAWVTPDTMTAIGFLGAVIIFTGYVLSATHPGFLWLSSLGYVINWYGDSLDGTLARYRKIERPRYGFFVDHIIDSLVVVGIFLGLGLSSYVSLQIASLALICYLLLTVYIFLSTSVNGVFRISFGHFGPTEFRLIAILANTVMFFAGHPTLSLPFGTFALFDIAIAIVGAILFGIYLYSSIAQSIELARLEKPMPRQKK